MENLVDYGDSDDDSFSYSSEKWQCCYAAPPPASSACITEDKDKGEIMHCKSSTEEGESYRYYMEVLLGDGIFNADGEMWRKQHKIASFEFASKNLRDFSTVVFREYALKLAHILSRIHSISSPWTCSGSSKLRGVESGKPFYAIVHRIDVGIMIDFDPFMTGDAFMSAAATAAVHSEKLDVRGISRLQSLPGGDIGLLSLM